MEQYASIKSGISVQILITVADDNSLASSERAGTTLEAGLVLHSAVNQRILGSLRHRVRVLAVPWIEI